jgi:cytochrome P450
MVFSIGHHACPGRPLAENEISTFIYAALDKYVITSMPNKQNLSAKGMLTLKPEEVGLKFIRRASAK